MSNYRRPFNMKGGAGGGYTVLTSVPSCLHKAGSATLKISKSVVVIDFQTSFQPQTSWRDNSCHNRQSLLKVYLKCNASVSIATKKRITGYRRWINHGRRHRVGGGWGTCTPSSEFRGGCPPRNRDFYRNFSEYLPKSWDFPVFPK